jgi:hypothetical protein
LRWCDWSFTSNFLFFNKIIITVILSFNFTI